MALRATISGPAVEGETLTASLVDYAASTPAAQSRFFRGYQWRYLFTDLDGAITTYASGLVNQRSVVLTLGEAETISGTIIAPDDARVNTLSADGYPHVAPTKRIVWAFRREGGTPPWVPRAAGILMLPQDQGGDTVPVSTFVAYGPRKLLEARTVYQWLGGSDYQIPGPDGLNFVDLTTHDWLTGDQIALTVLRNSILADGPCHIDAGTDWGGTEFWNGTIETTDPIAVNAQAGSKVAEVWKQLEDAGNCDIVLTPVWDPINRPGYTHELSIYQIAGTEQHNSIFGWDRLNRAAAAIDRMHDATPGQFFNRALGYAGQGGAPIPTSGTIDNAASISDFGVYWAQQFFTDAQISDPTGAAVLGLIQQGLRLAKQGKRTLTITPIPERAPVPLVAYGVGDRVFAYASKRLRVVSEGAQRVQSIPFAIDDDGIEHVNGLLCSPDFREASGS